MSKQKELGQYPTPVWIAELIYDRHFGRLEGCQNFIEPACGPGSFLGVIPKEFHAVGVEIDPEMAALARLNTGRRVIEGDFAEVEFDFQPTAIIGNPPFNMRVIDRFLDRAYDLLPEMGQVGFVLPAYAFQTAARVAGYAEKWSLMQEMIPRNIYPGLSLPLVFAMFSKDRKRTMIGFAFYREAADVLGMAKPFRDALSAGAGPVWKIVVDEAIRILGGEASLQEIYDVIEKNRPTKTDFWREKVRQTVQRYTDSFIRIGHGRYRAAMAMAA
jgi:hypothetical protein